MKEEIKFLRAMFWDTNIDFTTPISHIIPRYYTWAQAADTCKRAGGGWSTDLLFWWHIIFPLEIFRRACLPNNKSGLLVSINVLEMVCVIGNLTAAIVACDHDGLDLSGYPVLLNFCDNTAACSWVNDKCKHSMIGKRLARLYIGLLMGTKIGVHAEWIPIDRNVIADDISRLKELSETGDYDYKRLKDTYPALAACHQFQPSPTLLGMIWDILLHKSCPDPLIVRQLKPSVPGQFIS